MCYGASLKRSSKSSLFSTQSFSRSADDSAEYSLSSSTNKALPITLTPESNVHPPYVSDGGRAPALMSSKDIDFMPNDLFPSVVGFEALANEKLDAGESIQDLLLDSPLAQWLVNSSSGSLSLTQAGSPSQLLAPTSKDSFNTIFGPSVPSTPGSPPNRRPAQQVIALGNDGYVSSVGSDTTSSRHEGSKSIPRACHSPHSAGTSSQCSWDYMKPSNLSKADIKRMKNTQAARLSRQRKVEHVRTLESQVMELEARNKDLECDNAILKSEKENFARRLEAMERQVSDLHRLLMSLGSFPLGTSRNAGVKHPLECFNDNGKRVNI